MDQQAGVQVAPAQPQARELNICILVKGTSYLNFTVDLYEPTVGQKGGVRQRSEASIKLEVERTVSANALILTVELPSMSAISLAARGKLMLTAIIKAEHSKPIYGLQISFPCMDPYVIECHGDRCVFSTCQCSQWAFYNFLPLPLPPLLP